MRNGLDAPHPLDVGLGARVRLRRKELGLSQTDLANAIGITFQQVQKYEHGTNRISFSRLVEIAEALKWSVGDLIGPFDCSKGSGTLSRQISQLAEPGAQDLLKAYVSIETSNKRRAILSLARQLSRDGPIEKLGSAFRSRRQSAAARAR